MGEVARTKGSKRDARKRDVAKPTTSSVQRRVEALSDITLTEAEAALVDQMLDDPSSLAPAPRPVQRADRSILYRTAR